jgi:MarR family transcriptional regulator, organic hydroperoxide resistance regulator
MKLHRTVELIGRIRESSNRFITDELVKAGAEGIAPSHGGILVALYNNEQMTMKEIADSIKRTQPTVTVLVEKLSDLGYVTRQKSTEDGRTTYIALTKKGENFKESFMEISRKLSSKIHKGMNEQEIEMLTKLLERIAEN